MVVVYYIDINVMEDRFIDVWFDEIDFKSFGIDVYNILCFDIGDVVNVVFMFGFEFFKDEQMGEWG